MSFSDVDSNTMRVSAFPRSHCKPRFHFSFVIIDSYVLFDGLAREFVFKI